MYKSAPKPTPMKVTQAKAAVKTMSMPKGSATGGRPIMPPTLKGKAANIVPGIQKGHC